MVKEAVTTGELQAEKSPENAVEFKKLKEELREEVRTEIKKSLDEVVEKKVSFVMPYELIQEKMGFSDYKIEELSKKQDNLVKSFERFEDENKKDFKEMGEKVEKSEEKLRGELKTLSDKVDSNHKEMGEKVEKSEEKLRGEIKAVSDKVDTNHREVGDKLDKNTKWTIVLIITMAIGFLGIIVTMMDFASNLLSLIGGQ